MIMRPDDPMRSDDRTACQVPDRHLLAAYLNYALEELVLVNETSAALVRMAIESLNEETSMVPSDQDADIDLE
jgi:hypothetical protein